MPNRWWTYQKERFPVLGHGPVIAAFSFSAVCFSAILRGRVELPDWRSLLVAFVTAFLFFFQLRIADEFKDFEEDSRYRPYRPVPRGLVTLRELALVGIAAGLIQLGLALWLEPRLLGLLSVAWLYLALMSKEFFVGEWLKNQHVLYMASHMLIVPIVDFYATACDWIPAGAVAPAGLIMFVVVSYFNGIVIEVGRKVRAPQDEEEGVNTYTALWGRRTAVGVWLGAMLATAACAGVAASLISFLLPVVVLLAVLLLLASLAAWLFLRAPDTRRAKRIETISGVWSLLMYLSLGAIPMAWRVM